MKVQPYLFFDGRCQEALDFYAQALGAKVEMLLHFKDNPEPAPPGCIAPGSDDKVMHASFRIGDTELMASDGMNSGKPVFAGFCLSVTATDAADAKKKFDALAAGGKVQQPLTKTFFSPSFGMVEDRFGVGWMVIVPQ